MEQTMLSDTNDSTSMCSITSGNDGKDSDFSERFVAEISSKVFPSTSGVRHGEESNVNSSSTETSGLGITSAATCLKSARSVTKNTEHILPMFSIKFRNKTIARKYKNSIKKFLKELICKHDATFEDCDASDLELDVWESNSPTDELLMDKNDTSPCDDYIEEIDCISPQIKEVDKSKQPTVGKYPKAVDTPGDSNLFFIDTIPAVKDTRSVPTYNQNDSNFKLLVEEVEKAKSAVVSTSSPRALSMCFNCGGKHSLRDCKEPRNHTAISKNRQQFMNKQAPYQSRARTGVSNPIPAGTLAPAEPFASACHFLTTAVNNSLRHALGLYESELPKHIYRMRQLGYPPGWLGDAKIFHSGITVFNEEGKVKYDPSKIIKYPGFNVPPPHGTTDVKNMNLGTPLLDSLSPYTRLPQPEQFSKDVSDVINFENLPNYTGTYERMSGVLNKVRKVLSHEEQFGK
uniref:PSP proline-rich domain-containing protein n=1 Tax=Timema shepardi TaxID=629360 RepID=A0A7R9B1Y7_TIMSH|nr:unnamed protein product [Timema shepardi]